MKVRLYTLLTCTSDRCKAATRKMERVDIETWKCMTCGLARIIRQKPTDPRLLRVDEE
jgi:hypothetical protein